MLVWSLEFYVEVPQNGTHIVGLNLLLKKFSIKSSLTCSSCFKGPVWNSGTNSFHLSNVERILRSKKGYVHGTHIPNPGFAFTRLVGPPILVRQARKLVFNNPTPLLMDDKGSLKKNNSRFSPLHFTNNSTTVYISKIAGLARECWLDVPCCNHLTVTVISNVQMYIDSWWWTLQFIIVAKRKLYGLACAFGTRVRSLLQSPVYKWKSQIIRPPNLWC